jgi:hypothetical protein
MLARMGLFSEAEGEFSLALRQSDGELAEASYNLRLCRSIQATVVKSQLAELKLSAIPFSKR